MKKMFLDHTISAGSRLIDAIEAIKKNRNKCIIVCEKNKVIGVVSEGDIMRALLNNVNIYASITNCINYDFKFMSKIDYAKCLKLVITHGITMIPILNKDFDLIEVITLFDILKKVKVDDS